MKDYLNTHMKLMQAIMGDNALTVEKLLNDVDKEALEKLKLESPNLADIDLIQLDKEDKKAASDFFKSVTSKTLNILDIVAILGRREITKILSKKGFTHTSNINKLSIEQKKAFLNVCFEQDNIVLFQKLLESNNPEIKELLFKQDSEGNTLLHRAIMHHKHNVIDFIISRDDQPNGYFYTPNQEGSSVLHLAAGYGHYELVKYLVENEKMPIDYIRPANNGCLPIHNAAQWGHKEIIEFLSEKGGNINATDKEGYSALHLAAGYGHYELVKYLVEEKKISVNEPKAKNKYLPIHNATRWGHEKVVKLLVENGADINATDNDGSAALHLAAKHNHVEVVKFLVDNGADINATDRVGHTPLMIALQHKKIDIINYLLEQKECDVNVHENLLFGTLHVAFNKEYKDGIRALINHPRIDLVSGTEYIIPIFEAVKLGDKDIVKIMLDKNNELVSTVAGINKMSVVTPYKEVIEKDTIFHVAARMKDNGEMLKFLIEYCQENNIKCEELILQTNSENVCAYRIAELDYEGDVKEFLDKYLELQKVYILPPSFTIPLLEIMGADDTSSDEESGSELSGEESSGDEGATSSDEELESELSGEESSGYESE